jgi:hypothetical protein
MSDKLAAGIRQARRRTAGDGGETPRPPARDKVAAAAPRGDSPRPTFARQSDQSPPPSLDDPWENLHPERIWPD